METQANHLNSGNILLVYGSCLDNKYEQHDDHENDHDDDESLISCGQWTFYSYNAMIKVLFQ